MGQVRLKIFIQHEIPAILPSIYQNVLKFVGIWRRYDRNKNAQFFQTRVETNSELKKRSWIIKSIMLYLTKTISIQKVLSWLQSLPETNGHFEVTVVSTPKSLLVNIEIKRAVRWSKPLNLVWLLIVHVVIQLEAEILHNCSVNKKLSCRREAARCYVFVCSQLQHTNSAVFNY